MHVLCYILRVIVACLTLLPLPYSGGVGIMLSCFSLGQVCFVGGVQSSPPEQLQKNGGLRLCRQAGFFFFQFSNECVLVLLSR